MKALLKEIKLYPTDFKLDVWVCDEVNYLTQCFEKRYGDQHSYYQSELVLHPNACRLIHSTETSEHKGNIIVVVNLEIFDLPTLVHELNHVIYKLIEITGLELVTEWTSYLLEYLFKECSDMRNYLNV